MNAATIALARQLSDWLDELGDRPGAVLQDAIKQATKAETIEWFAALAERYGFKPEGTTE